MAGRKRVNGSIDRLNSKHQGPRGHTNGRPSWTLGEAWEVGHRLRPRLYKGLLTGSPGEDGGLSEGTGFVGNTQ